MTADVSSSDIENQFVGLVSPTMPRFGHGTHPCQGLYWTPKGKKPRVALVATHYNVDFMEHYLAPYMAQRGYGFLGWNTRFRGAEDQFLLEHALIDIGVGMKWLREKAGVETVVILGNSGGGSLMAAYQGEAQSLALAGTMKGPVKEALEGLPKADLYIFLNAHLGRPEVLTAWMDGSVTDETDPTKTDESLNPFNPDNGPPFSQEFITRYRRRSGRAISGSRIGPRRSWCASTRPASPIVHSRCSGRGPTCALSIRPSIPPPGHARAATGAIRRSPTAPQAASAVPTH
jgi:hypothetical protein